MALAAAPEAVPQNQMALTKPGGPRAVPLPEAIELQTQMSGCRVSLRYRNSPAKCRLRSGHFAASTALLNQKRQDAAVFLLPICYPTSEYGAGQGGIKQSNADTKAEQNQLYRYQ